jgi:hypothetical protein
VQRTQVLHAQHMYNINMIRKTEPRSDKCGMKNTPQGGRKMPVRVSFPELTARYVRCATQYETSRSEGHKNKITITNYHSTGTSLCKGFEHEDCFTLWPLYPNPRSWPKCFKKSVRPPIHPSAALCWTLAAFSIS